MDGVDLASREVIGHVVAVGGAQASVRLDRQSRAADPNALVTVGNFVGVETERTLVIGVVTGVIADPGGGGSFSFDILGEIKLSGDGVQEYGRGVTIYPSLGQPSVRLTSDDLRIVFDNPGHNTIRIGTIHQDCAIGAYIKTDDMLAKHFAILGSTGVGKSSGVAVIIGEVVKARPDLRVFFIDPHNEYAGCFSENAEILDPRNLKLPFWLFNFEEFVDVLFRGRPGVEEETALLAELVPLAKAVFADGKGTADRSPVRRPDVKGCGFNADTPVPYRLADLIALIEDRRGKLENRGSITLFNRLLGRIEAVRNDTRYGFMFDGANVGGDTMVDVIGQLFRLPADGRRMTIMQLAGFPAEVVDSVVSVLCRMAFDFGLWSDGAVPILVVCEEAHRYAPADRSIGFGPTRKAVSRIAKEGRKYGVYLGLVTQRPAELDPTIVSQCNTVFAMRLANERDQAILRSAVSDAAANLLSFVPALGTREVFAFGEGVALPTRLRFTELPPERLPNSQAVHRRKLRAGGIDRGFLATVVERWRGAGTVRPSVDDGLAAILPAKVLAGPVLPQAGEGRPIEPLPTRLARGPESIPLPARLAPAPAVGEPPLRGFGFRSGR